MNKLSKDLVKLGYEKPGLRKHLRPILDRLKTSSGYFSPGDVLDALRLDSASPNVYESLLAYCLFEMSQGKSKLKLSLPSAKTLTPQLSSVHAYTWAKEIADLYVNTESAPISLRKVLVKGQKRAIKSLEVEAVEKHKLLVKLEEYVKIVEADEYWAWDYPGLGEEIKAALKSSMLDIYHWHVEGIEDPENHDELLAGLKTYRDDVSEIYGRYPRHIKDVLKRPLEEKLQRTSPSERKEIQAALEEQANVIVLGLVARIMSDLPSKARELHLDVTQPKVSVSRVDAPTFSVEGKVAFRSSDGLELHRHILNL